jgi:glyoxylase-like metal-dependent hydrolase (beta-lactamase superfamily II)
MDMLLRRQNLIIFSALCLFSAAAARPVLAQQASTQPPQYKQEPTPLSLQKITERIYEVKGGSGANAAVYFGDQEVLIIDAKMNEESARQMLAEIRQISPNPIGYVALTHSDGDHVNGFPGFPQGLRIIAHEDTRKYMAEAFQDEKLRAYLPQITFSEQLCLYFGEHAVRLLYFGPAHTSGDAVIYFPEEKVAVMGDLLFIGRDPLVHRHKNGNSAGLVKALKAVLSLDADTFLSGHAERATRSDVEAMIKALEEKQAQIKALIAEGKTLEEIKKFYKVEDRPAQPGRPRFLSLPEVIYLELTEKK